MVLRRESLQGGPRPVLMLAVYVMSLMLSLWCGFQFMDVHQTSLDFNEQPHDWTTWQHGFVHGFAMTLFVVLPLLGINAVFERRSLTARGCTHGLLVCHTLRYECPVVGVEVGIYRYH
jgi:hypothetical protein